MGRVGVVVVVAFATACGGGGPSSDGASGSGASTLPLIEPVGDRTSSTGPATDLAPSQLDAGTVPTPSTPGSCALGDLELWTAQVRPGESTVDAVIRIRNRGDVRCEPDISSSPLRDPLIEPGVWLDPKGSADLVVGQRRPDCDEPSAVTLAQIAIGDEPVAVPTAAVSCEWWLSAFYPNDAARDACSPDDLQVAVVSAGVVIRNTSLRGCGLGPLVAVDGAVLVDGERVDELEIDDLLAGDVVAVGRRSAAAAGCGGEVSVSLTFEVVGVLAVDGLPCDVVFDVGGGRPWYGSADGPLADMTNGPLDLDAALAALDPFAGSGS